MAEAYDLDGVLEELRASGDWFVTFMSRGTMDAGMLRLKPGEKDPQGPHANDELYYMIKGSGFLRVEKEDLPVKPGSLVFVPAGKRHNFHGNNEELVALYVFAGSDKDA
jgi:mannose-6-phosphate isomerase-like protein (cupin superfamily)